MATRGDSVLNFTKNGAFARNSPTEFGCARLLARHSIQRKKVLKNKETNEGCILILGTGYIQSIARERGKEREREREREKGEEGEKVGGR